MTKRFKMAVVLTALTAMSSASTAYAAGASDNCSIFHRIVFLKKCG